ncbi:hypothetical protein Q9233_004319 [Columba guinea]|nr:hypothetical protein Q9233_004319 [Columba guinea]
MGLKLNGRYISLILAVQIAYLVQAVRAAGRCDAVFRGFSDCLLRLGDNMAKYPQDLDDKRNLQTICTLFVCLSPKLKRRKDGNNLLKVKVRLTISSPECRFYQQKSMSTGAGSLLSKRSSIAAGHKNLILNFFTQTFSGKKYPLKSIYILPSFFGAKTKRFAEMLSWKIKTSDNHKRSFVLKCLESSTLTTRLCLSPLLFSTKNKSKGLLQRQKAAGFSNDPFLRRKKCKAQSINEQVCFYLRQDELRKSFDYTLSPRIFPGKLLCGFCLVAVPDEVPSHPFPTSSQQQPPSKQMERIYSLSQRPSFSQNKTGYPDWILYQSLLQFWFDFADSGGESIQCNLLNGAAMQRSRVVKWDLILPSAARIRKTTRRLVVWLNISLDCIGGFQVEKAMYDAICIYIRHIVPSLALGKPTIMHKSPPEVCVAPAKALSCRLGCLGNVVGLAAVPATQEQASDVEGTPGSGCLRSPDPPGDIFHSIPSDA